MLKTILAISIIIFSLQLSADEYNAGKQWKELTPDHRFYWVWGVADGQKLLLEELPSENRTKFQNTIDNKDVETISLIMTKIYSSPENTYIPWHYIAVTARMKLNGFPTSVINKRLELLRQYAADQRSISEK